jgi:Ca-activated chloride channel family protein
VITLPLCLIWSLPAQDAAPDFRLSADAKLVLVEVSVRDRAGHYVSDLTRDDFHIRENGKLQTISQFSKEDTPVTVGLVIDDSGSMRAKRMLAINAAMTFLSASNPQDEVFVTHFNDRVRVGLPHGIPFSDDPKLLQSSLLKDPAQGRTALYDAIVFSLNHLKAGKQERKSLLLISDGGDNASKLCFNDVIEAVRESRATIYTIGIFDEDDTDRNLGILRRLAQVSGGDAFFPNELSNLDLICRKIADDVRHRYTIGYVPPAVNGMNALRRIAVSASRRGEKFVIRARTSYRFPKESKR